ncbi:ABC transporter substrate-binding protein [Brevibacterium antiquum]|uniref:Polar amino acid transport system substrate-binding protein n=1 Tax=Brevibacterium antiquum TaxID=234835 RepID=A0A2H1KU78_9MICO|nr:ABC transporter substrate-binding protein [Brevibacterium antiquum]SMY03231.1 polar amino acid transport system substrate-binding protein [Brevibacterium antiquum]
MHLKSAILPIALAMTLLASGCSSDTGPDAKAEGAGNYGDCEVSGTEGEFSLDTAAPDALTVKADLPSPGWYNGDTIEDIDSGVDFCLLANIAYRSGIKNIKLENASFAGLVAGKAGSFDISLNQITITPEREEVMDFSDPYFDSTAGILVKKGADITADNLSDQKIGVKQGTVGQLLVDKTIKPAKAPAVFTGDPEEQAAVLAGRVDAGIQDLSIVLGAAKKSHDKLAVVGQVKTGEHYGVMMPKGSENLETINRIIDQAKSDGTIEKLQKKYLSEAYGVDPTSIPVWDLS